MKNIGTNI